MKVPDQKLLRALQSPFPLSVSKVANLHLRTQEEAASQGPNYRYGYWVLQAGASGRGRMEEGHIGQGSGLQLCVQTASLTQDLCWVTESPRASVYSLRMTEGPQELSEEYARCWRLSMSSAQGPASLSVSRQKGLCRCGQVQHLRWEVMLDYLGGGGQGCLRGLVSRRCSSQER